MNVTIDEGTLGAAIREAVEKSILAAAEQWDLKRAIYAAANKAFTDAQIPDKLLAAMAEQLNKQGAELVADAVAAALPGLAELLGRAFKLATATMAFGLLRGEPSNYMSQDEERRLWGMAMQSVGLGGKEPVA